MNAQPDRIPAPSLHRLPIYYRRTCQAFEQGQEIVSSKALGEAAAVPAA
jgi:NADH/NAD ratio-sensing transcriptional regulator Rex